MTRWTRTGMARALLRTAACAALLGGLPAAGSLGFIGPALAQQAGTVALDDVSFRFGTTLVKVPRLELRDTALSRADLQAILDPASTEPWPARLKRLSGGSLAIPLLRVEQAVGDKVQVVVYRDLVARSLTEGRIGSLEAAGAVLTVEGSGPDSGAGAYGHMAASDLDLTGLARLLTEAGGPDAPSIRVYGSVAVDDIALSGPKGEAFRIGHVEGRDFGGRPTATPWGEALSALTAGDPAKAAPADRDRGTALAADLLDAVAIGPVEMRDLSVTDPGEGTPTRFTLARLSYGSEAGTGTVRTEALALDGPALRLGLKALTLSGLSLKPTLDGLRRNAAGSLDPAELRRYAPLIGRVAVDGLEVDIPPGPERGPAKDPAKDPAKPEAPLRVALRAASLEMSAPRDGIPTAARLNLDGLAFPVPVDAPALAALASLGYRNVDVSGVLDSSWNEEAREVSVREFSLTGKDMGRARLTATLGGIGREVFSPDVAVSSLALLGATAKALALTVENTGLFDRFVADQAKAQSLKPAELQREYSTAAMLGIPAVLGNSAGAKALGQAVARFVTKPGRLTITAAAKDPAGLGFLDLSTAASPGKLFDRLNVTATAE
ncbi:hypothetical protein [Methylobacterium nodulans]|uniref:AsmA family protein n=1 Tax=Methylobacterium nodulans (strain LMG 21967 / CNCM I-2342 / ORS 2060) TaxID=460265 RepID=B8IUT6_METNO|nr:hypothetical protein [Methylobacterium nodulans]ACL57154.1 conserved hypothetical protein [Methylobacterium nodulans ORS 2060]